MDKAVEKRGPWMETSFKIVFHLNYGTKSGKYIQPFVPLFFMKNLHITSIFYHSLFKQEIITE